MSEIPLGVWMQVLAWLGSTVVLVGTIIWNAAKMKADVDVQFAHVKGDLKLMGPYGSDIEGLKTQMSDVRQRMSKIEGMSEAHSRDLVRLESRIDSSGRKS